MKLSSFKERDKIPPEWTGIRIRSIIMQAQQDVGTLSRRRLLHKQNVTHHISNMVRIPRYTLEIKILD